MSYTSLTERALLVSACRATEANPHLTLLAGAATAARSVAAPQSAGVLYCCDIRNKSEWTVMKPASSLTVRVTEQGGHHGRDLGAGLRQGVARHRLGHSRLGVPAPRWLRSRRRDPRHRLHTSAPRRDAHAVPRRERHAGTSRDRRRPGFVIDIFQASEEEAREVADAISRRLSATPFDEATEWPVRMAIVSVGESPRYLALRCNRSVIDGRSLNLIAQDLLQACEGQEAGALPVWQPVEEATYGAPPRKAE